MRIFLKKFMAFMFLGMIIFLSGHFIFNSYLNKKTTDNALYVWGDSQMYRGLDLKKLSILTEKKVWSAAKHGAGIYDFLVFTENVPHFSDVLVAISKPVQIRRKEKDHNKSGLNIDSLILLYQNNYTLGDILKIIKKNIKPTYIFRNTNKLYPYSDKITFSEPISLFKNVYSSVPLFLEDKQALYIRGIETLIKKQCNVIFVELPYHPILVAIEDNSMVKKYTENMKIKIGGLYNNFMVSTMTLGSHKAVMHDLTHLNEHGASLLTEKISHEIKKNKGTSLYVFYP